MFTIPLAQEEKGRASPVRRPKNCWTHTKPAKFNWVVIVSLSHPSIHMYCIIRCGWMHVFLSAWVVVSVCRLVYVQRCSSNLYRDSSTLSYSWAQRDEDGGGGKADKGTFFGLARQRWATPRHPSTLLVLLSPSSISLSHLPPPAPSH